MYNFYKSNLLEEITYSNFYILAINTIKLFGFINSIHTTENFNEVLLRNVHLKRHEKSGGWILRDENLIVLWNSDMEYVRTSSFYTNPLLYSFVSNLTSKDNQVYKEEYKALLNLYKDLEKCFDKMMDYKYKVKEERILSGEEYLK